jgi:hypothetical protein
MSVGVLEPMAKKTPKRPGGVAPKKPTVVAIKGNPAWKEWLDRAARHCRLSTSTLIDLAVTRYAREQGFEEPPPER